MCLIKSGRKASLQAVVSWFGVVWRRSIRPESINLGGGIVGWSEFFHPAGTCQFASQRRLEASRGVWSGLE